MENQTNNNGTCFCEAILAEDITKLKFLLNEDEGIDINCKYMNKSTALHLAVEMCNEKIVQMLLEKGASIKLKDGNGENALHIAAKFGNQSLVKLFLINGRINVNLKAKNKCTSLHIAVRHNQVNTVKLLLKHNAKVNTQNFVGDSPLHEAVKNENIEIIKILLSRSADPNLLNREKQSAFYESFMYHECVIKQFLSYGVNVQQKNDLGQNALHLACLYSTTEIVELILGKNLNVNEPTFYGSTPLHYAIKNKEDTDLNIARLLLASGANVNAVDKSDRSVLYLAIKNQALKICEYLVEAGASVNCTTKKGSTPLHAALKNRDVQAVHFLVGHGADVNVKNAKNKIPVHLAIMHFREESRYSVVQLLLDSGAIIDTSHDYESTALHLALKTGDTALFDLLIAQNPDIHKRNADHMSPLYVAVSTNNLHAAKVLLQLGAEATDYDEDRNTVLSTAVTRGNVEMVKLLLDYNANVNDQSSVYEAATTNKVMIMKLLVGKGADINHIVNGRLSLLMIAIASRKDKMVQYLLDNGADVNYQDNRNLYALTHGFQIFNTQRTKISKIVMFILLKHIALVISQNLHVHEENIELIKREKIMNDQYEAYCQELANLKSMKVSADSHVTYFDILVKRHRSLVSCLRCENVRIVLATSDYRKQFLEYSGRIKENYHKGLKYMKMIDKSQVFLNKLFSCVLPFDVINKINEYYIFDDLKVNLFK